ncbi:outer membrane beta-barrel protein [Helicobacter cetorum]|uniref:outer membrane beta-barrel protein n=1 Tax=Helicobacter cetorum TaxID=138563 RepID=UPI000CF0AD92|nr:outer membrane beta-barrel protein [Helicobacter cetorum]
MWCSPNDPSCYFKTTNQTNTCAIGDTACNKACNGAKNCIDNNSLISQSVLDSIKVNTNALVSASLNNRDLKISNFLPYNLSNVTLIAHVNGKEIPLAFLQNISAYEDYTLNANTITKLKELLKTDPNITFSFQASNFSNAQTTRVLEQMNSMKKENLWLKFSDNPYGSANNWIKMSVLDVENYINIYENLSALLNSKSFKNAVSNAPFQFSNDQSPFQQNLTEVVDINGTMYRIGKASESLTKKYENNQSYQLIGEIYTMEKDPKAVGVVIQNLWHGKTGGRYYFHLNNKEVQGKIYYEPEYNGDVPYTIINGKKEYGACISTSNNSSQYVPTSECLNSNQIRDPYTTKNGATIQWVSYNVISNQKIYDTYTKSYGVTLGLLSKGAWGDEGATFPNKQIMGLQQGLISPTNNQALLNYQKFYGYDGNYNTPYKIIKLPRWHGNYNQVQDNGNSARSSLNVLFHEFGHLIGYHWGNNKDELKIGGKYNGNLDFGHCGDLTFPGGELPDDYGNDGFHCNLIGPVGQGDTPLQYPLYIPNKAGPNTNNPVIFAGMTGLMLSVYMNLEKNNQLTINYNTIGKKEEEKAIPNTHTISTNHQKLGYTLSQKTFIKHLLNAFNYKRTNAMVGFDILSGYQKYYNDYIGVSAYAFLKYNYSSSSQPHSLNETNQISLGVGTDLLVDFLTTYKNMVYRAKNKRNKIVLVKKKMFQSSLGSFLGLRAMYNGYGVARSYLNRGNINFVGGLDYRIKHSKYSIGVSIPLIQDNLKANYHNELNSGYVSLNLGTSHFNVFFNYGWVF